MKNKIKRFLKNIKQSYDYAKFGWSNYDFDHSYLFSIIRFKLKRMEYSLEHGISDLTYGELPKAMAALKEAITLCENLESNGEKYILDLSNTPATLDYNFDIIEEKLTKDLTRLCEILRDYSQYWWD